LITEKLSPSAETELQIVIPGNNNKSFNINKINSISANVSSKKQVYYQIATQKDISKEEAYYQRRRS